MKWQRSFINRLKNADVRKQKYEKARLGTLSMKKGKILQEIDGIVIPKPKRGEKLKNRREANASLVQEQLTDNLQLVGVLSANEALPETRITDSNALVGYQRSRHEDEEVEIDW
ncbi:hypothetical protein [Noviherbaspirillum denitrificans]|uniref:Uncharacterized protein n=1 Tax=Noviherbaspirillum denitrificans TaxID=1968433 RepID=A0A254T7Q2_9BURK|nr:hypothetical protein [Noviherbaspirillum denitrificans]OWW18669.1 hypothetical protein AYR66_03585 [Noviherbaspirillum denitrificans]